MVAVKKFKVGDLVWGKMRNFPAWPGRVLDPPKDKKVHVYFFGTKDHAFLEEKFVTPHSRSMLVTCKRKKMSLSLRAAVKEIEEASVTKARRNKDINLDEQRCDMRRVLVILRAVLNLQMYQKLKKHKSMLKPKVPEKKDSEPRESRSIPADLPYNLRPKIVPELITEVVAEPDAEAALETVPVPEPIPIHIPGLLPPEPSPSVVPVQVVLPKPVCGLCEDSKGTTDPKVHTPCCRGPFHMSCLVSYDKKNLTKCCPKCREPMDIGLRIRMTEQHNIQFIHEFRRQGDRCLWVGM